MPDYRRSDQPGGTFFFTVVTHQRQPLFADAANVERLRAAVRAAMNERPFEFLAGVVLPDHAHYRWTLPPGDDNWCWQCDGRVVHPPDFAWACEDME